MTMTVQMGMSAAAVVRAADAMLRVLGGAKVRLLMAAASMPDEGSAQLGMVDPGVEEVELSPVVVRNLPTGAAGPRRRLEFLVTAATVVLVLQDRNVASAQALFEGAIGIVYDNSLLRVEGVAAEYFAGSAYLYRVVAVE